MDNMNSDNNNKKPDKKPNFFSDFNSDDPEQKKQMKFMRNKCRMGSSTSKRTFSFKSNYQENA